jgi:hypothetical protein
MAKGNVEAVGGVDKAPNTQATTQTNGTQQARQATTANQERGQTRPAGGNDDSVQFSEALDEELQAEQADKNKEKPEAGKAEDEAKAEEEKRKELERQIQDKQKQLEEAEKNGDPRANELRQELGELQKELEGLNNAANDGAGGPQKVEAAGAGNQMPMPAATGGAPAGGGGMPVGAPAGSYPATPPGDMGGYHPPNQAANGPAPVGTIKPDGSGQDAVDLAKQYLGHNAIDIKGKMPHFTAAGGQTNNCADFVSSALEATGRVKGHHINVVAFEKSLVSQGYERVPKEQARPGDVWISGSKGHTELVAEAGGNRLIGSNNDRPGHQVISYHNNPQGGYYYQLKEKP